MEDRPLQIILSHYWWLMAFRGFILFLYGVLVFAWPDMTTIELLGLSVVYTVLVGIFLFLVEIRAQKRMGIWAYILPVIALIVGVLTAAALPGVTALALIGLIGVWSIVIGMVELFMAVQLARGTPYRRSILAAGILSCFTGAMILIWPFTIVFLDISKVGTGALLTGAALMALSLQMRRLQGSPLPVSA